MNDKKEIKMLKNPATKYQPPEQFYFPQRTWVNKTIEKAPIWLSTDLRDGNQSLFNPMSIDTKVKFYNELIRIGFKEIEVGFPAASEIDFKFVRKLIEENLIPDDVTIMVMTQARKDLIQKTVEAVKGSKQVIIHIYNATAKPWREIVFGMTKSEVLVLIDTHVRYFKSLTDDITNTKWILQYSPETFSSTEPEFALEACNTAIRAWETSDTRLIIINLPSTVENTTPNVFADKIEWMSNNLDCRHNVILSVHPHNDRGTGIATAELALLAGAERIEGCLFGNGERCGNLDLATIALNLYTQGVNPELDFSNINKIARIVEECTQLPIHPRHPYVGDLVFTAFSGSHQDAIKKGFTYQQTQELWTVPYLPIDPADLGRTYESIIRVNSQSGKGGISYIMENNYGITMPRRMQIEFSSIVQNHADTSEMEISPNEIWRLFNQTYLDKPEKSLNYISHSFTDNGAIGIKLEVNGKEILLSGTGNGTIEAAVAALGNYLEIISYEEKSISSGTSAEAITMIECRSSSDGTSKFGVAKHQDIVTASIMALINATERFGLANQIIKN